MQMLLELVIEFDQNAMVIMINSDSSESILNLINDSVKKAWETKMFIAINFDAISGKAMVVANRICGYYVRPASDNANKEFQKKILELTERQVIASEKSVSEGNEWKND